MELPPELQESIDESNRILLELIESFDSNLFNLIQDLERMIIVELEKLERDAGGLVKSNANIERAIAARQVLITQAEAEFNELAVGWTSRFDRVGQFVVDNMKASGVPAAFTEVDASLVQALRSESLNKLRIGASTVFEDIASAVMEATLVSGSYNDLVKSIQGRLSEDLLASGVELSTGTSLAVASKRHAHDGLMFLYSTIHQNKAEEAGINRFMYVGQRVAGSRDFCIARKMRIFTLKQIKSWNKLTWAGKIPGVDVMVQRGGYGCIDHFQAIPNGISDEDLGLDPAGDDVFNPTDESFGGIQLSAADRVKGFEASVFNKDLEHGLFVDELGEVLGSKVGTSDGIEWTFDEVVRIRAASRTKDIVFAHNQPLWTKQELIDGGVDLRIFDLQETTSFSADDLVLARRTGLAELRAVGDTHLYRLRPPKGLATFADIPGFSAVEIDHQALLDSTLREFNQKIKVLNKRLAEGTISNKVYDDRLLDLHVAINNDTDHKVIQQIAKLYKLQYQKIRR